MRKPRPKDQIQTSSKHQVNPLKYLLQYKTRSTKFIEEKILKGLFQSRFHPLTHICSYGLQFLELQQLQKSYNLTCVGRNR